MPCSCRRLALRRRQRHRPCRLWRTERSGRRGIGVGAGRFQLVLVAQAALLGGRVEAVPARPAALEPWLRSCAGAPWCDVRCCCCTHGKNTAGTEEPICIGSCSDLVSLGHTVLSVSEDTGQQPVSGYLVHQEISQEISLRQAGGRTPQQWTVAVVTTKADAEMPEPREELALKQEAGSARKPAACCDGGAANGSHSCVGS